MKRRIRAAVICVAALSLPALGCPGVMKPLEKPTVELTSVAVTSVSFRGLKARLGFNLTNPNSVGLPLRAVDWGMSIGGSKPIRGRVTLESTIPAKAATAINVDLSIGAGAAVDMASRLASGANDYHVTGTMHFETKLGDIAVAFDHSGDLASPAALTGRKFQLVDLAKPFVVP